MARPSATSHSTTDDPGIDDAPILHIDLDAFFASVEILDDPSLRGKPVAVGGAGARGVVASASYEARRYGVHSAMPSIVALRKCPQLVILPGRFDRYEEYSRRFHAIVEDVTPQYEPLGLDELFADLRSLHRLEVRPVPAAHRLRQRVRDELQINCGVGLGPNKLFAKLASKTAKPRVIEGELIDGPGVFYVDPSLQRQWLDELPVRALWGVGPATAERLARLGITSIAELAVVSESVLATHVGRSLAHALSEMAHGRDDRPVTANRAAKSIGHEETFAVSVSTPDELARHARRHAAVVARALRGSDQVCHTVSIAMRFDDLTYLSRAQTLNFGVDDDAAIGEIAVALVESVEPRGAVRLLGVSASSLAPRGDNQIQLSFDLPTGSESAVEASRALQASRGALNDAVDDLRRRYGRSVIGQGADFLDGKVSVEVQRGSHAFGPAGDSASQRP